MADLSDIGSIALLAYWPDWTLGLGDTEKPRAAFPIHQVSDDQGLRVLLVPITHAPRRDFKKINLKVEIDNARLPWAHKPDGPLDRTGKSIAAITDRGSGKYTPMWATPLKDRCLFDLGDNNILSVNYSRLAYNPTCNYMQNLIKRCIGSSKIYAQSQAP